MAPSVYSGGRVSLYFYASKFGGYEAAATARCHALNSFLCTKNLNHHVDGYSGGTCGGYGDGII